MVAVVDLYTIETRIDDKTAQGAAAAQRNLTSVGTAADNMGAKIKEAGAAAGELGGRILEAGSSLDSYARRVDQVTKIQEQLAKAQRDLANVQAAYQRDVVAGAADQDQYNRTVTGLTAKIEALATKLGQARAAAEASAVAQQHWDAAISQGTTGIDAYSQKLAQNAAEAARAAAAANDHISSTTGLTKASSAASFALRDMGLQSIDVFQQLASGAPVMRTLVQQGGQIVQVNAAMGVGFRQTAELVGGALMSAFRAVVSPIGLIVTGFAAFGAAAAVVISRAADLGSQQRQLNVALDATGHNSAGAAQGLSQWAEDLKRAGASAKDALDIVTQLGRAIGFNTQGAAIKDLVPDLATALGISQKDAASQLVQIAKGSSDAIHQLNDSLHILTPAQEAAADAALKHGDKLTAMKIVVDNLTPRIQGLNEQGLGPAEKTVRNVTSAWDGFVNAVASNSFILTILQGVANTLNDIGGASDAINLAKLTGQLADLQGQASSIQKDIASIPAGLKDTDATRDLQHQLEQVQQQAAAVQKSIDAITQKAKQVPSVTVTPTDDQQKALDLERLAKTRAESSIAGQTQQYQKEIADFRSELDKLGQRTEANAALWDRYTLAIANDQKALSDLAKKNEEHRTGLQKEEDTLKAETQAQLDLAEAYKKGADAVDLVLAKQEANRQAISKGLTPETQKYDQEVQKLTADLLAKNQATGAADLQKQISDTDAATAAQLRIAAAYDGTSDSLIHATNEEKAYAAAIKDHLQQGTPQFTQAVKDYTDALDRSSAAVQVFQQEQNSVAAIGNAISNTFDNIAQAITSAFLSTSGQAVNWGNVLKGVATQVINAFLQLAVLNPLLNAILPSTGGLRPTLGSALGALGNGSGGASGGLGVASNALGVGTGLSDLLGFDLGESLGLTGPGGLLTGIGDSLGLTGAGGIFSGLGAGIGGFLSTPVFGGVPITVATSDLGGILGGASGASEGAAALGAQGAASTGLIGSATIGNLLGGVGLGFGAGSLAGGFLQNALGKTGPAPMIGAGVGAVGGTIAGALLASALSVTGPVGALLGGLMGGMRSANSPLFREASE